MNATTTAHPVDSSVADGGWLHQAAGALRAGRYYAQQGALVAGSLSLHAVMALARSRGEIPAEDLRPTVTAIRSRWRALLRRDHANAEAGIYPRSLLTFPLGRHLRQLPRLLLDRPQMMRRRDANAWRDLPSGVPLDEFPPYYRRTFHWQSDGYLSEHSAKLYEPGVELLFLGSANVMRRQVLPPIVHEARRLAATGRRARIADIACGTGPTLRQLAAALPSAKFTGVDLSPFYISEARKGLTDVTDLSLIVAAGEDLPLPTDSQDITTSTYLFHELPRTTRRVVLAELFRITRPGGLVVLMDSAQYSESSDIKLALDAFPKDFHEPYYADYLKDPLEALAIEAGFEQTDVQAHHVSKCVVARKPDVRG